MAKSKAKAKAVETYNNGIAITKALMTNVQDWTSCQGAASKATESLVTFNIKFGEAIDKDMAWFPLITAKETTTEEAETKVFATFWKNTKSNCQRAVVVYQKQKRASNSITAARLQGIARST